MRNHVSRIANVRTQKVMRTWIGVNSSVSEQVTKWRMVDTN